MEKMTEKTIAEYVAIASTIEGVGVFIDMKIADYIQEHSWRHRIHVQPKPVDDKTIRLAIDFMMVEGSDYFLTAVIHVDVTKVNHTADMAEEWAYLQDLPLEKVYFLLDDHVFNDPENSPITFGEYMDITGRMSAEMDGGRLG